jgi:hypothetical protein
MEHTFIKIISVEVLNAYILRLHFSDGVNKEINFEHLLSGKLYEPLRNPKFFAQVNIDNETGAIAWLICSMLGISMAKRLHNK